MHKIKNISFLLYSHLRSFRNVGLYANVSSNMCTVSNSLTLRTHSKAFDENDIGKIKKMYGLDSVNDIPAFLEKYKKHKNKINTINEEIIFFRTFAETAVQQNKKVNLNHYSQMDNLLSKIKGTLKNSEEEYPLIGSFLFSLDQLEIYKDQELWLILGDYVISGRMNTSLRECLKALKSSTFIKNIGDAGYYNDFFFALENQLLYEYPDKLIPLEDLVAVSKSYQNMKRSDAEFFRRLEKCLQQHLLNGIANLENLSMDEFNKLIQLCYYFSKFDHVSYSSLEYLQNIIEAKILKGKLDPSEFNAESLSRLVLTLGKGKELNDFSIQELILNFIWKCLEIKKADYKLHHLIYLYCYLPELGLTNHLQEIWQILEFQVLSINKEDMNLEDIQEYLLVRVDKEFNGNFDLLPEEIANHLDNVCTQNMLRCYPTDTYKFFEFIEKHSLWNKFSKFWKEFPEYFMQNLKDYDFEEWCFVYYVYMREKGKNPDKKIDDTLAILKGYVYRFYNSVNLYHTSLPEKLNINSNFYKILEVIDPNEFYEE